MLLPRSHEKAELVEIVRIEDPTDALRWERLAGEEVAVLDGEGARQMLGLVAALPAGDKYRCFLPGWGIRAHSRTGVLFEVAFCFDCHGARLWGDGVSAEGRFQDFDADSAAAVRLLRLFRGCRGA